MTSGSSPGKSSARAQEHVLDLETSRRTQLLDITAEVERLVAASGVSHGVCHLYVPHTTAGVTVNEADDPDVARDIEATLDRLVPHGGPYRHAEGNADSHIKATLTGVSQSVFIEDGRLMLGRWQGIFFCEFDGPRRRQLHVKIVPDPVY
ncbi:MAG: YjbQ family protein [Acidobacteria bacterium]|nr:YjbQ family protein [Acidobacteriota bacterium]